MELINCLIVIKRKINKLGEIYQQILYNINSENALKEINKNQELVGKSRTCSIYDEGHKANSEKNI